MIPKTDINADVAITFERAPSRTFKIDGDRSIVAGNIDGLEAVKQAINKVLNTERYKHVIYSWDYGIELDDLYGKPADFVSLELKSRITETLLQDDRVTGVDNFRFKKDKNKLIATFTVHTIYGDIDAEKEVKN